MAIFVNNKPIEHFVFAGGECHIRLSPAEISDNTQIYAQLQSANDIMALLLLVDAIRRINANTKIELSIPYFPYARQDRVCNEGEALSVKVMADLINSLNCAHLTIFDPHSEVTPALLNNCKTLTMAELVWGSELAPLILQKNLILLAPDLGAEKKILATAKKLSSGALVVNTLSARKTRDLETGNITATEIHSEVKAKNIIILDDICDGGSTFIELALVLKSKGAADIYLYVTHGIFSQGLDVLKKDFKHVYCFHTMLAPKAIDRSFLTILQSNKNLGD